MKYYVAAVWQDGWYGTNDFDHIKGSFDSLDKAKNFFNKAKVDLQNGSYNVYFEKSDCFIHVHLTNEDEQLSGFSYDISSKEIVGEW